MTRFTITNTSLKIFHFDFLTFNNVLDFFLPVTVYVCKWSLCAVCGTAVYALFRDYLFFAFYP